MKLVSKLFVVAIISSFTAASAFAAAATTTASSDNEISPNQGTDSCGLGWQVTKSKTLIGTSTRGTTNAYLSPTWSMTSGTSGCEKHDIAQKDQEAVKFVATNYYSLRADMAQGQGEYLEGLARVMGCNDQSVSGFTSATQKNFKAITRGADAYQTLQNVKTEIRKDPALAQGCGLVG